MTEINSDDSLYKFLANKRTKSPSCVEGLTKKTRMKCTAACIRTNKSDRCTGAADRASASLHCSDVGQKTYRSVPQHDRGSTCIKTTADCRGQCPRTGKYAAIDNPQCTKTRSYRVNESQCTGAAEKCGVTDNTQCTVTRNYRANDVQCTGVGTGNFGANNNRCSGIGNYSTNNNGCNGCGCISAAAVTAATACLGGSKPYGRGSADTLFSTVCKWSRVVVDWTWDKTSYILVATVSFFLGMYTYDWCLCTCEEAS